MSQITKIVLTGGPCAGKTTALQRIEQEFTAKGYRVFIIGESATEFINGGARPFGILSIPTYPFQKEILDYQLYKEAMYERMALTLPRDTKSLLVCDRGALDNKAYIGSSQFEQLLKECSLTELDLLTRYQAVLHLVTAAEGAEQFYTLENNEARSETPEQARKLDGKTLNCWMGHSNLHVIANQQSFQEKMDQVIKIIHKELGIPVPIQRQKKFLIHSSCVEQVLTQMTYVKKLRIEQIYTEDREECCIRKISDGSASTYFEIHKKDTKNPAIRIKTMKKLTEKEYLRQTINNIKTPIFKDRYSFVFDNQYFTLDVFHNLDLCLLEVEPTEENDHIHLPASLVVLDEVTENSKYHNFRLFEQINQKQKEKVF